jgi:small subunit ribosomal protein S6e
MKFNVALPANGTQKLIEVEDEKKIRQFFDRRMSQEVDGSALGEQFEGYVFKIGGGFDKQGFPMKQGVMTNHRVRLLLGKGHSCFRERRHGERKRKSVRGCITGPDLSVINLVVVKQGKGDIPGLTDKYIPSRLGPKRANNIRKLFNLDKKDDVRKYVIRREIPAKKPGQKPHFKAPKIQRLITPRVLQHKRQRLSRKKAQLNKSKQEQQTYVKLLAQRRSEALSALLSRKSLRKSEVEKSTDAKPEAAKKQDTKAPAAAKKAETAPKKGDVPKKTDSAPKAATPAAAPKAATPKAATPATPKAATPKAAPAKKSDAAPKTTAAKKSTAAKK